jgi:hypothetical protein
MADDRPSWREIDKKRDRPKRSGRRKEKKRNLEQHSTRYERYKADLDRLFDQGLASELIKRTESEQEPEPETEPVKKKTKSKSKSKSKAAPKKRNGRVSLSRQPTSSRLKLLRTVIDAEDSAVLISTIDELVERFGIPDDLAVLIRFLEHPDEKIVLRAVIKIKELLPGATKIPRKFTLKERLRTINQTASVARLRDMAAELEESL